MSIHLDQDTGKQFFLEHTAELSEDIARFDGSECRHEELKLVERTFANGGKHIQQQCQVCGKFEKQSFKRRDIGEGTYVPPAQPDLQNQYSTRREDVRKEIYQKHIRIQKAGNGSVSKFYADHLKSPKWREMRRKVLKRANGECEGCLERPATQVHHKHYRTLGDEFLFDLLALCAVCHERLHEQLNAEQEARGDSKFDVVPDYDELDCQCRWGDTGSLIPQCSKFGVSVAKAIASDGECGPDRSEHEGFK